MSVLVFAQWKSAGSPVQPDISFSFCSVVHEQQLFLSAPSRNGVCNLWRSEDTVTWHRLQTPTNATSCDGLLSFQYLFALFRFSNNNQPVLYRMKAVDMSRTDGSGQHAATWLPLFNGRCPTVQIAPAFFADATHSRLVLAGGRATDYNSLATVSEYCLKNNDWHQRTVWPDLPLPKEGLHAIRLDNRLHLIGGRTVVHGKRSFNGVVLSADLTGERSHQWSMDRLPATPSDSCGACSALGTIAIAGGWSSSDDALSSVHILDTKKSQWLQLPSLPASRSWPSIVFFNQQLSAFGGWDGLKWTSGHDRLALAQMK